MTRGTLFALMEGGEILQSTEFNGDMYGSTEDTKEDQECGNYKDAVVSLSRVTSGASFKEEVEQFNTDHHNYDDDVLTFSTDSSDYLNYDKQVIAKRCNSDYSFWKNCTVDVKDIVDEHGKLIELQPNEIVTFYYGKFIETFNGDLSEESILNKFKHD